MSHFWIGLIAAAYLIAVPVACVYMLWWLKR